MREDWYRPRVQGHECEGYRTSLPPGRANLSDTVRRHSLFHAREEEEEEEEQRERGVADGASGFHGNAASTAPTLRTGVVPTRVESVAARDGGGSDGGAAGTKGDGNRPSGTVTVGASPFDAACWCVLFYGVIEKNLEKPGYTGVIAKHTLNKIFLFSPNEGSSRHLPPPPSRLINVILLDGQASTTIDTWHDDDDDGGGGGGGDSSGGGGIVTFASRGTRNEERDEIDGAERKGHRPAPQTDCDHTVVSPRTRDNERNWRLRSREELGISSRRAAEYNTRAYNDVGLTIAYSRAGTNGTDRVNAPVYHREDNKQEYANITDDLCLRPPGSCRLYFWNRPCKMKGRLGLVASSQVRLSAYGRLKPARRAPRRKTADLYFFVEVAAGWPVHELRAVCVPYTGCAFHQPITNREDELSLKGSRDLDRKRHWREYLGQVKLVMEKPRTMLLFFRKMAKLVLTLAKIASIRLRDGTLKPRLR
ncbi:hypothetical protein ALC57_02202 [Trachymyrmex cornetzi]|uniref:Uncharacterized protein n=1 Tax=Trachymyrmex cornetzi TaxID=471704 RepID=A0A195EJP5_9HYME|nr:hypothetical protein ALC57_02202 [Trachymyrmex cornetzi]